jgi:hypothetical protein
VRWRCGRPRHLYIVEEHLGPAFKHFKNFANVGALLSLS